MRIIKYILIFLFVLVVAYFFCWYYIVSNISNEINTKYAKQKISLRTLVDSEEYFVSFDRAGISGFPFNIAVNLYGLKEESREAVISYNSPLKIGYSFVLQSAYVSYNGDVDSAYQPIVSGFGAILKINDYLIKIDIPLTKTLVSKIFKMDNLVELVNYVKAINISTKEVQVIDKQERELFFDKKYERLSFTFVPAKYYRTLQDILDEIPTEYKIYYSAQTKPVKFLSKRIAASLFYGVLNLPSDFSVSAEAIVKTKAKKAQDLRLNLDAELEASFSTPKIDLTSLKLEFKSERDHSNNVTNLLLDSKIKLKDGLFEELFKNYEAISAKIIAIPGGHLVNQEILYIISNKDVFRFKDLENSDYDLNFAIESSGKRDDLSIKLNNFSIYSDNSGFKLTHESKIKLSNQKNWDAKGVLLLKNYPAVVDFSSEYIYRFGKFRFLNDKARNLYVEVNKEFLKQISDYPSSASNDLSFKYDVNSTKLQEAKIGSTNFMQALELYKLTFYRKLFSIIDPHGNVLGQIKKLLPNLDENDPIFKKLLRN